MMLFSLGIDPDLNTTAIAIVRFTINPFVTSLHSGFVLNTKSKGREAIIDSTQELFKYVGGSFPLLSVTTVEAQEIYMSKESTKNPKSILLLGNMAGAALGFCATFRTKMYFPRPQEWKGTVPKKIHQHRTAKQLGIEVVSTSDYCYPENPIMAKQICSRLSDWNHLFDAAGLAIWGAKKLCLEIYPEQKAK